MSASGSKLGLQGVCGLGQREDDVVGELQLDSLDVRRDLFGTACCRATTVVTAGCASSHARATLVIGSPAPSQISRIRVKRGRRQVLCARAAVPGHRAALGREVARPGAFRRECRPP